MLRKCLFSSCDILDKVKGRVYCSLILPILLYGCECWCLTEEMLRKLRIFHNFCVRCMCRVNRWHTRLHHIKTSDLIDRLGICSVDTYICRQQLRWAGHVSRMSWDRLPRKMLSCWVRSKRPKGCPKLTYGRSIRKCLKKCEIDESHWSDFASDRERWREMLKNLSIVWFFFFIDWLMYSLRYMNQSTVVFYLFLSWCCDLHLTWSPFPCMGGYMSVFSWFFIDSLSRSSTTYL